MYIIWQTHAKREFGKGMPRATASDEKIVTENVMIFL